MRTLRLSLAGTVMLVLLGGLSVAVAQDEGVEPTWTTLVEEQCMLAEDDAHTSETDGKLTRVRDYDLACEVTFTDPRVSGMRSTLYNEDCLGSFPCVYWATHELAGPDGTWSGWTTGTVDPDRTAIGHSVLTGSARLRGSDVRLECHRQVRRTTLAYGLIYEGDPPPMP